MTTKTLRAAVCAGLLLSTWIAVPSCATQASGEGSESHFDGCVADTECADAGHEFRCIDGFCRQPDTVVSACTVETTEAPPYAVTFSFENASNARIGVALGGVCGTHYQVTSCADGYRASTFTSNLGCWPICPEVACGADGACITEPLDVTSDAPQTDSWDGNTFTRHSVSDATCYERTPASAGRYRITALVYPHVDAGTNMAPDPLYSVAVDFTLPVPGGVVHVPIDRGVGLAGDGGADGSIPDGGN
ncbi:MAG TPA: hypothetical protein VH062_19250 [Polyangiaceae bacterium]|nr:hypothetical protein [Polyangiaceae bacterium]